MSETSVRTSKQTSKNSRYVIITLAIIALILLGTTFVYFNAYNTKVLNNSDLAGQIQTLKSQVDGLNSQVNSLDGKVSNLQSQVAGRDVQIAADKSQIDYLNTQLNGNTTLVTQLNAKIDSLNAKITSLNAQITSLNAQITSLNKQIAALQAGRIIETFAWTQVTANPCGFLCIGGNPGSATVTRVTFANTGTKAVMDVMIAVSFFSSATPNGPDLLCTTSMIDLGAIGGQAIIDVNPSSASCTWPQPPQGGMPVSANSALVTGIALTP